MACRYPVAVARSIIFKYLLFIFGSISRGGRLFLSIVAEMPLSHLLTTVEAEKVFTYPF